MPVEVSDALEKWGVKEARKVVECNFRRKINPQGYDHIHLHSTFK